MSSRLFYFDRGRNAEIIEIIIKDCTGAVIDRFKTNTLAGRVNALRTIKEKHGISFEDKEAKPSKNKEAIEWA